MLALFSLSACTSQPSNSDSDGQNFKVGTPSPGKSIVYVFDRVFFLEAMRQAKFMLHLNGNEMGEMTNDNYYKLEVWPGDYELLEVVPRSQFLFMSRNEFVGAKARIDVSKAGEVYALAFTSGGSTGLIPWEKVATELSERTLAKSFSASETARARRLDGAKWEGPSKGIKPHGVGTATYPDGRIYRGFVDKGQLTAQGRLEFSDGRVYKGQYSYGGEPSGQGLLTDKEGNVIFAGKFFHGKPYDGARLENGVPVFTKYRYGKKVETDPLILAEQNVAKQDEKAMASVGQASTNIAKDIERIKEIKRDAQRDFDRREAEFPSQCKCTFKLCLTQNYSDQSYEERRARKKAKAERDRACREWRAAGGSRESRQETLERDLAASDQELASLLSAYEKAEKRDAMLRRQKAAELASTQKARIAEAQRKLEIMQAEALEKQRASCQGKEHYCGCFAFMSKERQKDALSCTQ